MTLSSEALYWFFSTIAQTLGAIVGVVGMLTVFRLQNITTYMQQLVNDIFPQRSSIFGGEKAYNQTPKDVVTDFNKKYPNIDLTQYKSEASVKVVYYACKQIKDSLDRYKRIRLKFFITFLVPQLGIIFSSIIALLSVESWDNKIQVGSFTFAVLAFGMICVFFLTLDMIRVLMSAD